MSLFFSIYNSTESYLKFEWDKSEEAEMDEHDEFGKHHQALIHCTKENNSKNKKKQCLDKGMWFGENLQKSGI